MPPNQRAPAPPPAGDTGVAPAPTRDLEILIDHIREISQTARSTWFSLLALLAFVGVTMMAHTDATFFAAGVTTELPMVGLNVPTVSFFFAAPLMIAALYVHLHLFLVSLWNALADAPERIGADRLFDRVYPGIIAQTAVLYRSRARADESASPHAFAGAMKAIVLLLVWLASPVLLAWVFWQSMALHSLALTLWIGACLVAVGFFGVRGAMIARSRLSRSREEWEKVHASRRFYRPLQASGFVVVVAVLSALSWATTRGGLPLYDEKDGLPPLLVPADLREAKLTRRPPDWHSHDLWSEELEEAYRRREGIEMGESLGGRQAEELTTEAWERYRDYIAALDAPDLSEADLRGANLTGAFLPGTQLDHAQLQAAKLEKVQIQGANMYEAQMQKTKMYRVQMQGAYLHRAQIQGANMYEAQMQGADMSEAQMQGADLRHAQMQGASLSKAKMQGADLRGALMQDSDCEGTEFLGALAQSADFTCRDGSLTQRQLQFAVGDAETVLPEGFYVWSCLDRATLAPEVLSEIKAATAHYPKERNGRISRAEFEELLFCDPASESALRRSPHEVGGHPELESAAAN